MIPYIDDTLYDEEILAIFLELDAKHSPLQILLSRRLFLKISLLVPGKQQLSWLGFLSQKPKHVDWTTTKQTNLHWSSFLDLKLSINFKLWHIQVHAIEMSGHNTHLVQIIHKHLAHFVDRNSCIDRAMQTTLSHKIRQRTHMIDIRKRDKYSIYLMNKPDKEKSPSYKCSNFVILFKS